LAQEGTSRSNSRCDKPHDSQLAGDNRPTRCAGLNRHEAGEEESLRERISDPLGPEFCVVAPRGSQRSVNRGIGGLGIELRKLAIRTPTQSSCAEGNMNRGDIASRWSVLRSHRPQTRL
jgi:hypothetical protein